MDLKTEVTDPIGFNMDRSEHICTDSDEFVRWEAAVVG